MPFVMKRIQLNHDPNFCVMIYVAFKILSIYNKCEANVNIIDKVEMKMK